LLAVAMAVYLALGTGAVVQKDSLLAGLGYTGRMADITGIYLYGDRVSDTREDRVIAASFFDFKTSETIHMLYYHYDADSANFGNVETVSDFSQLKNLKELSLAGNPVSDVTPLWKLNRLEYLDLTGNPVRDLTGIGALSSLGTLCISGTLVTDLAPLRDCDKLKTVYVDEAQYAAFHDSADGAGYQLRIVGPVEEMRDLGCHIFGGVEEVEHPNPQHYGVYIQTKSWNVYKSYQYQLFRNDIPLDVQQIQYISTDNDEDPEKTHLIISFAQMNIYDPSATYTLKISSEDHTATYRIWHKSDKLSQSANSGALLSSEGF
jgi:Leucine-rich repeat (LRR) protein